MTATVMRQIEVDAIRRLCPIPEQLTGSEWADKYRMLPETSTSPGRFDSSVVPYARRWMDLLADPSVSCVALCWASQTIKSTILENAIGNRIHRMPTPMIILRPKIDDAESWSKERLLPMVVATPVLRERVRVGRSSDSTLRYKRFPGGFLFVASAESATECASRSAPFVLVDEADRMKPIPGEGNPVEIVRKRMGAADIGLFAITSTPRDAETTIIWPYLEGGTDERYHVPCPHCGTYQELLWGGPDKDFGLKWPYGQPLKAQYLCVSCHALIDPKEKREMLPAGNWVPLRPENPYPSSHLSGLYSPFAMSNWPTLAKEWEDAQGKPHDLQVFVNTRLSELWEEKGHQVEANTLVDRLELGMSEGEVPNGAAIVTAFVDVQDNRLECDLWAWGPGLESWIVAMHVIPGDPLVDHKRPESVWKKLDEILFTPVIHQSGRPVSITAALIDSGNGNHTNAVYRYCAPRNSRGVFASKGVGGEGLPLLGKPSVQGSERFILYPLGVDTAKNEFLRSQILEEKRGPGYVHLGAWMKQDQCEQLVSEKRVPHIVRGRRVGWNWVKKKAGSPNEKLDCRIGARCALEMIGAKGLAELAQRAEKLAEPYHGPPPTNVPQGPHRRMRSSGIAR